MSVKRYLATFFRGRRLYIPVLLLLLGATVLGTYYLARTQYEATARIWVDRPVLDSVLDPNAQTAYMAAPAQPQADKFNELIQTDSFVEAVLKQTKMSGQLANDVSRDKLIKDTRGRLAVAPLGSNTVKLTYDGSDPVLSQQVIQGTIDQFRSWDLTSRVEQNAIERQFYQKQLQIYQDQVNAATKAADDYQKQYPSPDPSSPQYLVLQGLQRDVDSARALLSTTQTKIEQANAANSLSDTSRQYEFQVLDAPKAPDRPAATTTRIIEYLALGILVSLGLVILAVAFATWQDTTIRNGEDLQRLTRVPLLDALPHLQSDVPGGGESRNTAGETRARRRAAKQLDGPATVVPSSITE